MHDVDSDIIHSTYQVFIEIYTNEKVGGTRKVFTKKVAFVQGLRCRSMSAFAQILTSMTNY